MVSQCTKFEISRFTRYEAMNGGAKYRKWGGLWWLWGHSRLSAMSPFDTAHTTSYSTLIETMRLSFTVFELSQLFAESRRFWPTPPAFWCPRRGWPRWPGRISPRSLASENYSPWAIVWCCLCDATFSRFSRTPTCDGQTDTGPWLVPRMHSIAR